MATTGDADHAGLYLASTLAGFPPHDMKSVAEKYFAANAQNPKVDVVDCLRFVNARGFMQIPKAKLFDEGIINWSKPPRDGVEIAAWKKVWDSSNPNDPRIPEGPPTYVNIRNTRGAKATVTFLGAVDDDHPNLAQPPEVLLDTWKLPPPAMCIVTDAGSMHPRQCDSINKMHNLPQFHEWVEEQSGHAAANDEAPLPPVAPPPDRRPSRETPLASLMSPRKSDEGGGVGGTPVLFDKAAPKVSTPSKWGAVRQEVASPGTVLKRRMSDVVKQTMDDWGDELNAMNTDAALGDGSINNLIFTKLKDVFSALLDAANLAGARQSHAHSAR